MDEWVYQHGMWNYYEERNKIDHSEWRGWMLYASIDDSHWFQWSIVALMGYDDGVDHESSERLPSNWQPVIIG